VIRQDWILWGGRGYFRVITCVLEIYGSVGGAVPNKLPAGGDRLTRFVFVLSMEIDVCCSVK